MAENKPAKQQLTVSNASLTNPGGMLELAGTVKQFIIDQKLFTAIQGRNYVNVEGWQFAGGMIGVLPVVQSTENLSSGDELKYRASVQLINIATDKLVGSGIATCSNKEKGKKYFDEYAIESMAQTRAVGKAYRLMLGWLMKAAGYEATPAEEMDFATAEVVEDKQPKQAQQPVQVIIKSEPADTPPPIPEEPKEATSKQKEEIIRLLNNPVITSAEKNKMLLNLGKLNEERAAEAIAKLNQTINERETEQAA